MTSIPTDYSALLALHELSRTDAVAAAERLMGAPLGATYLQHAAITVLADALMSCADGADADSFYDRIAQVAVERFENPTLAALMVAINLAITANPSTKLIARGNRLVH